MPESGRCVLLTSLIGSASKGDEKSKDALPFKDGILVQDNPSAQQKLAA